jgi:hypothetical protein
VGRSPYQSEKRRKELARLKKQEEKRQRRFNKKHGQDAEQTPEGGAVLEGPMEGLASPDSSPESGAAPGSDASDAPAGGQGADQAS